MSLVVRFAAGGAEPLVLDGVTWQEVVDLVLDRRCALLRADPDSAAAERLWSYAERLSDLDHPHLAPLVLRARDVPGFDGRPVTAVVVEDQGEALAEALAHAPAERRGRAFAELLAAVDYLHRRGLQGLDLRPRHLRVVGGALRVLPFPGDGDDLRQVAVLAREVLDPLPPAVLQVVGELEAEPGTARAALDRLATLGLPVPWEPGAPAFVGREAEQEALSQVLVGEIGRPVAVLGPAGSGRTRLVRRVLARRSDAWDLSSADSLLAALHRVVRPREPVPRDLDERWLARTVEAARAEPVGVVFLGRREGWPPHLRERVDALSHAFAQAGTDVVMAAEGAPPDCQPLPLGRLDAHAAAELLTPLGVTGAKRQARLRARSGGLPGPLLAIAVHGRDLPPATAHALAQLGALPPGVPPRVVGFLPEPLRTALPVLARRGLARFDEEGRLHVTSPRAATPEAGLSRVLRRILLDPRGELDPLWAALTWLRLGTPDRARALLGEATLAASGREEDLLALTAALAREGDREATLVYARLQLERGRPQEVLAALGERQDPDALLLRVRALCATGALDEALELGRRLPVVHAETLASLGRLDEAEAATGALRVAPMVLRARLALQRVRAGEDLDVTPLLAEIEAQPDPGYSLLAAAGRLRGSTGAHAEAGSLLARAAACAEREAQPLLASLLHIEASREREREGLAAPARRHLLRALPTARLSGFDSLLRRVYHGLARVELRAERLDRADAWRHLLEGLAEGTVDPRARVVAAGCHLARHDAEAALAALEDVDPQPLEPGLGVQHALVRIHALLQLGRLDEALAWTERTPRPADRGDRRRLLTLRGRLHLALARRDLAESRRLVPPGVPTLDRADIGETLLAVSGEDLDPASFSRRRRDLERARELLPAGRASLAGALGAALSGPTTAEPPEVVATAALAEPREVLGVLLGDERRAQAIEAALALLDGRTNQNLLVTGPTGAGKRVFAERVARELGLRGLEEVVLRRTDPQMLVSQLVGTRRGEFTGAVDQVGAIQRAIRERKALFLDEVHALDEVGQETLLPLLELPRRRFGGLMRATRDIAEPLTVVLATNVDVSGDAWRDHFRPDLWYRMRAAHVDLPPLAERGAEAIYRYLAGMLAADGVPDPEEALEPPALYALLGHRWEGNLRELAAAARRIARFHRLDRRRLTVEDLPRCGLGAEAEVLAPFGTRDVLELLELNAVVEALRRCDWNQTAAADRLAISKYRLHRILQKHDLIEWVREQRRVGEP